MSKFGRIADVKSKYDTNKEILLTGKGPSLSLLNENSHVGKYVACINESATLFEKVDFNFFNDSDLILNFKDHNYSFSKIENLIVPMQPHVRRGPTKYTCNDLIKDYAQYDMTIYTHKLFTQNMKIENAGVLFDDMSFGAVASTYQIALNWLISVGFRKFHIYGITRHGGYQEQYKGPKPASDGHYKHNYQLGLNILNKHNCTYTIY